MKDKLGELEDDVEPDCAPEEIISPDKIQRSAKKGELSIANGFRTKEKLSEPKMTISNENERFPQENDESLDTSGLSEGNNSCCITTDFLDEKLGALKLNDFDSKSSPALSARGPYDGKRDGNPTQVSYGIQRMEFRNIEYNPQDGQCKRKNIDPNGQAYKFDRVADTCFLPPNGATSISEYVNLSGLAKNNMVMNLVTQKGLSGGQVTSPQPDFAPFPFHMLSPSDLTHAQSIPGSLIPTTVGLENSQYRQPDNVTMNGIHRTYPNFPLVDQSISSLPKHLQKEDRAKSIDSFIDSDLESGPEGSPYSAPAGSPPSYINSSPPPSNMSTTSAISDDSGIVSMNSKSPRSDISYGNIPSVDSALGQSPPRTGTSPTNDMAINCPTINNGMQSQGHFNGQVAGGNYQQRLNQPSLSEQYVGVSSASTNVNGHLGYYQNTDNIQVIGNQNRSWITPSDRRVQGPVGNLNNLNGQQVSRADTLAFLPAHDKSYAHNQIPNQRLLHSQLSSSIAPTSIPYNTTSNIPSNIIYGRPGIVTSSMTPGMPLLGAPSRTTSITHPNMSNGIASCVTSGIPTRTTSGSGIDSRMMGILQGRPNFVDQRELLNQSKNLPAGSDDFTSSVIDDNELADVLDVLIKDLQQKDPKEQLKSPHIPDVPKSNIELKQKNLTPPVAPCVMPKSNPVMIPFSVPSPSNATQVLVVPSTSANPVTVANSTQNISLPAPTFIIVQNVPEAPPVPQKKAPRKILPKLAAVEKSNEAQNKNNLRNSSQAPKATMPPPVKQEPVISTTEPNKPAYFNPAQVSPANKLNNARRSVADISRNDLMYRDEEGDTYLHVAVCQTDYNMILALLERIVREGLQSMIDQKNCRQQTPLYLAVAANKTNMVKLFIEYKADVNIPAQVTGSDGTSMMMTYPIHLAASKGRSHLETLNELLKAPNLNLNQVNSTGQTAMHCAILSHNKISGETVIDSIPTVAMLLKAGADPNPQDMRSGKTPLMYAIETKDYKLVETMISLFEPGKSRHIIKSQTFDGYTCLKIAEGLKNVFDQIAWSKLWRLLNNAANS